MKVRLFDTQTQKYNTDKNALVSIDGTKTPVFMGFDYADDDEVIAELATDVFVGNIELHENDVVELKSGFIGLVTFRNGKFGLRVAVDEDELLAEYLHIGITPLKFIGFDDVIPMTKYLGTIHDFENK